ncbi:fibrillarin-like rRNA/tRNA 2'-O-methyltransferase [Candidatus Woesearchaeota archaeon]|nr:MAG: fibrillarin-like rRNA/tRNA 2'-O-methyltransferase [Candidatus Woesearchaeota archaeon]
MTSKLKALIDKGYKINLNKGDVVLYLGASHGVTAKIVSEMVGDEGFVYCLEVAPTVMKELVKVCKANKNMAPMLYDANKPETYAKYIDKVDFIYQDLAQRNQINIFLKNAKRFLKEKGRFILIVKASSIDAVKPKKELIKELNLPGYDYEIIDMEKTHKKHYAIIGRKK